MPLLPACRQAQANVRMSLGTAADYLTCASKGRKGSRPTSDEIVLSLNVFMCLKHSAQPFKRAGSVLGNKAKLNTRTITSFNRKTSAQNLPINRVEYFIIFFI